MEEINTPVKLLDEESSNIIIQKINLKLEVIQTDPSELEKKTDGKTYLYLGDYNNNFKKGHLYKYNQLEDSFEDVTSSDDFSLKVVEEIPEDPKDKDSIIYIGIDSENFKKGHSYEWHQSKNEWEDLTPDEPILKTVEALPENPKYGLAVIYTGETTEQLVKGHIYQYGDNSNSVWTEKEWNISNFYGNCIWSDGDNVYYSKGEDQYQLVDGTWQPKDWGELTNFDGKYIWKTDNNVYYSFGDSQYRLNKSTSTWEEKTWNNLTSFYRENVWTDGQKVYYSNGSNQYYLNEESSTWNQQTWFDLTSFNGEDIWIDNKKVYYSNGTSHWVLNKKTSAWTEVEWTGLSDFYGSNIWSDGVHTYYSNGEEQLVLNSFESKWTPKNWPEFYAMYVWVDEENAYYFSPNSSYVLPLFGWNDITPIVDLEFNSTSENAQSGKAVSQAISQAISNRPQAVENFPENPINKQIVVYIGNDTETLSKGHTYKYDENEWVDITPFDETSILAVDEIPESPKEKDTVMYTGETTENFIKSHVYQYQESSWVDVTLQKASDFEITLLNGSKKTIQEAYEDGNLVGDTAVEPVPLGTICSFSNGEAPSEYWLKCDGSEFNQEDYPALYTYFGNSNSLPIEYDLENPNTEEVGKEIFVGEIIGTNGVKRKVYQLTVTDNVDRSGGNWFDFTSNFSPYLAPSEVDYFVDGGRLSHFLHSGDGYQEAATHESMVTVDKAKTIFRVYLVYQNYAMDYSDERGQNTDKYFTVRYTRTDDTQAKTTIKYKYIRAVSGIDKGENEYLQRFLNTLRNQLQGYAVQPIGSTMSSISGLAPAGYLKADGSKFDKDKYPLLYTMLGGSDVLPKMPDIDLSPSSLEEVKFAGFFLDEPIYKVTISHSISMSSSTWYEIRPASWVESMDMKSIVHSFMSDHYDTGAYNHGASPANMHIGESNRSLYIHPTGMSTRASTWYVTIYFTKNNPPEIPYKFIKAISGVDETESEELVTYFKSLADKVAYHTMPLGNIITLANNSFVPFGYKEANGDEFDPEEFPLLYQYLGTNKLPNLYDRNSLSTIPDVSIDSRTHTDYNPSATYVATSGWGEYLNTLGITSIGVGFPEDGELHFFGYYWRYIWIQHLDGSITGMQIPFTGERSEWYVFPIKRGEKLYGINTNGSGTPTPLATFDIPSYARMNIYYYHTHQYIKVVSGIQEGTEEGAKEVSDITTQISALIDKVGYHTMPLGHIITLAKNSTVPAGYLECDGSQFDRDKYPLLYQYLESDKLPNYYDRNSISSKPDIAITENWNRYGYRNTQLAADWLMTFEEDANVYFSVEDYRHIWIENPDGEQWSVTCGQNNNCDTSTWFTVKKGSRIFAINQNGNSIAIPTEGTLTLNGYMCMAVYYYHTHQYIKAITGLKEGEQEVSDITTQINSLTEKIAYNTLPVGNIIELANNSIVPAGYLPCDGRDTTGTEEELETKYPFLYHYLGNTNVLPRLYDIDTVFGKQDIGLCTYSSYSLEGVDYVTNMGNTLTSMGLRTDGEGFRANGFLYIETYHQYCLWIEDTDSTIHGYWVASRDDTQSGLWLPIKRGQKLYGWNRTGGSAPKPSTEWVQSTNTKLYIWYAKNYKYIKAVTGLDDNSAEASIIVNQMKEMTDKIAYNSLPIGNVIELANNSTIPAGYLPCDGRDTTGTENELETKYPLLYHYLGETNVLPKLYNIETAFGKQDVGLSTRTDYNPSGVKYTNNMGATLTEMGLRTDGLGFPADGFLFIETYHWYNLWIEDLDGTKHGYMVASRDDSQSTLWLPIKKGQKLYGWTRNGSGTPMPSTDWVQSTYTKLYIWYAKSVKYIKAVSGVEENSEEASTVVSQMQSMVERISYNNQPVGFTMAMANNSFCPSGYLLADGRDTTGTKDELETKYPLLYAYLGNTNVLPTINSVKTSATPDWHKINNTNYPGTAEIVPANVDNQKYLFPEKALNDGLMTIHTDDWCYLHITHADGTKDTFMVGFRDNECCSYTVKISKGDVFCVNRTLADYKTWVYYEYFAVAIWYYKEFQYIKAVSGLEESTEEAQNISTEIKNLTDKIAYNSLPVGNVISMSSNRVTPSGYLLADGRDTTGTEDELETKYPLLYSFLDYSNVLPRLVSNDIDQSPDWFKTNYTNYPGTAEIVAADATHQFQLFPSPAEYDGQMNVWSDDWFYLHVTHADGTQDTYTVGARGDSTVDTTIYIKKGDTFCMNRTATDYATWGYYECTVVTIWYYKNYKYIKAVSGIEDNSVESTKVINAINQAKDQLMKLLLPTVPGDLPGYIWVD